MVVFISSTSKDLVAEREAVQTALFQAEAQPSAMEFFVSSPDKPLDVCLENIRVASAVVLLIGARAGSFVGISKHTTYTAAEFHEAQRLGLQIFPFILRRDGCLPNDEKDVAHRAALERLREEAQQGTPGYFSDVDQLKFGVLAAFQAWTNKGRPGSRKTFASFKEYFAAYTPSPDRQLLFDFTQTLVGRDQQLADLLAFAKSPHAVAVVVGRGGIGKTKLLHALAQAGDGQPAAAFLRRGAIWHRESEKELPAGDLLVIADDVGRDTDLIKLAQCFSEIRQRRPGAHLILSCRPNGLAAIDVVLGKMFDPTDVVRLPPLAALSVADVRRLVHEELGFTADPGIVEWLVSVSADTPLVTVAAARLMKRHGLHPSAVKSSEDYQRIVFDRFVDELEASNQPFPTRKLVELVAAIGPESFAADSMIKDVAAYLNCEAHEVRQAVQGLEDQGLLIWDGRGGFRIAPDALSDRVLERCCVASHRASGFAEFVLERFGGYGTYGQILANFAELDSRIRQAPEERLSILDGIWSGLVERFRQGHAGTRCEILSAIKRSAIYQPARAIEVCRIAMASDAVDGGEWWPRKNSDVFDALPEVLGAVSEHSDRVRDSIGMLLDLWRRGVHSAAREARNLAKLRPFGGQPQRTAEVLKAIESSIDDPALYGSDGGILDLVDQILEREIEWSRGSDMVVELMSYRLHYPPFKPHRQRCFEMLEACLASKAPRVAMRALQSLMNALHPSSPRFHREITPDETVWQDEERLVILGILGRRALHSTVYLPLQQQIFASLRQRDRHWYGSQVELEFRALMSKIPTSEAFSSFDAFVTPYWGWEPIEGDLTAHQARHSTWLDRCADRLVSCHGTPDQQISRLEEMMRLQQHSFIREGAALDFVSSMCRCHPTFLKAFIEYVCGTPLPALGYEIRAIIPSLRNGGLEQYLQLAERLAVHSVPEVALGVGDGIVWSDEGGARDTDLDVIQHLAGHPDWRVRVRALYLAGRAGRQPELSQRAAGILASIDVAHSDLGWEFWGAIGKHATPVGAFEEDQMRAVLRNVVENDRIDHSAAYKDELLQDVTSRWPHLVAEFLTNRLEKAATKGSQYSAWGGLNLAKYFEALPGSLQVPALLRRIRDLGVGEDVRYHARELFWAIAGNDPRADEVLGEWIADEDAERRNLAHSWSEHRAYDPPRVYVTSLLSNTTVTASGCAH